jgi:hypothetical protein
LVQVAQIYRLLFDKFNRENRANGFCGGTENKSAGRSPQEWRPGTAKMRHIFPDRTPR